MHLRPWLLFATLALGTLGASACDAPATSDSMRALASTEDPVCPALDQADALADGGCTLHPTFQICQVDASGTTCHDACEATEYSLTCTGAAPTGPIPAPDASLHCRLIPIPTPSSSLDYCCPCGD